MRVGAIATVVSTARLPTAWLSMAWLPTACLIVMIQAIPVARAGGGGDARAPGVGGASGASGTLAPAPSTPGPETSASAHAAPALAPATTETSPGSATAATVETPTETTSVPRPAAARAGAGAPEARPSVVTRPRRRVALLSHDLQLGLGVLLGDGYRGIVPYDPMIYCGDARARDARVCTNRAPPFVDLQPSFGLTDTWDFLVDVRIGLTLDFNQNRQLFVMPGFRYWLDPRSRVKFFTTLQLAYDRSKQNNPRVGDADLGFRNSNGLMFEVMRNLGVYAQFGETVDFVRWLSFLADAGVGVQARVP